VRVFVILAHGVFSSARLLRRRAQCRPAILHGQKTLAWPRRANGAGGRKKARSQGAGFWSQDEVMMRTAANSIDHMRPATRSLQRLLLTYASR
jgi:hypothetical protein